MDELYTQFDNIFFEKTRLSIMTLIYKGERVSFNFLKEKLGTTDGAIYTHLEKLIKSGYLEKKKELAGTAVQTVYFLTKGGKKMFRDYIFFMEQELLKYKQEGEL